MHCGGVERLTGGWLHVILRNKTHYAKQKKKKKPNNVARLQSSEMTILCCSEQPVQKCVHAQTQMPTHRERGPVISLLCSSYSQSCKIQLYPVTWDHLQEMKSITKEIRKKKKEIKREDCRRGVLSNTTVSVTEKGNSAWQYKQEMDSS